MHTKKHSPSQEYQSWLRALIDGHASIRTRARMLNWYGFRKNWFSIPVIIAKQSAKDKVLIQRWHHQLGKLSWWFLFTINQGATIGFIQEEISPSGDDWPPISDNLTRLRRTVGKVARKNSADHVRIQLKKQPGLEGNEWFNNGEINATDQGYVRVNSER